MDTVLLLHEQDYKYGAGELRIRVAQILPYPEPDWMLIRGVEIRWNGDGDQRDVLVRVAAVRNPLRRRPG